MKNPKPLGIRPPIKNPYTVAAAMKRKPILGWNNSADKITAEEYMAKTAKTDPACVYTISHVQRMHELGISPYITMEFFKKYWPKQRHEGEFANSTANRIVQYYVDCPDDPGSKATGGDGIEREQNSDGTWDVRFNHNKFKVLKNWQWIVDSMQFVHDDGVRMMNDKQFERIFGKLTSKSICGEINRGKVPMKKFPIQVYIPTKPPVMKYQGRTAFNIWRPSGMKPDFGDCQWFLDHVAIMFPDPKDQQHLLDYMAQLIQHPEVKIHFAILLQSIEGAGKGALARILQRIIGARNCVEPSNDDVISKYTGWQEGTQLAIINELMAEGRKDVLNRLKSPITDPTLRIEKKYGNAFTIPNHMNLFCMTNFKNALAITEGDRRWLILYSPASKQSVGYYIQLFTNIADDSKIAAVMDYLMTHEIQFNPKAPAPWTAAKADMQERARGDTEADLQSLYDAGAPPFHQPLVRVADLVAWIRADRKNVQNVHRDALAFLDHIKAAKLRRYFRGRDDLKPYQLYAIHDHAKWMAAEPIDVARAYHSQGIEEEGDATDWDS